MDIDLKILKCPRPIVWLDTSIYIAMSRMLTGKSLESSQRERVGRLYSLLHEGVRNKKVICPETGQRDEIPRGRAEFRTVAVALSLGVISKSYFEIKQLQFKTHLKAYFEEVETVEMSFVDAFDSSPIMEIDENKPFIVDVDMGLLEVEQSFSESKLMLKGQWEKLRLDRLSRGVTFQQQLEIERGGEISALQEGCKRLLNRHISGQPLELRDIGVMQQFGDYMEWVREFTGKENQESEIFRFAKSVHYNATPIIDIKSRLIAALLTGRQVIKSGDGFDVDHASGAIPYANYFITDKSMKNLICSLGLDEKYRCVVLYSGDIDYLESELR